MASINVIYYSYWEEGVVSTTATLDLDTGEIDDIQSADYGDDYETLLNQTVEVAAIGVEYNVLTDTGAYDYSISAKDLKAVNEGLATLTPANEKTLAAKADVAKALLTAGANPDMLDNKGRTPLMLAAMHGHNNLVEKLVKAGANMDIQDDHGNTALMNAIRGGQVVCVESLLKAGASIEIKNDCDFTALTYAAQSNNEKIYEILKLHADKVDPQNVEEQRSNLPKP